MAHLFTFLAGGPGGDTQIAFSFKGQVPTQAALPAGARAGDAYVAQAGGHLFVSDGRGGWVDLGPTQQGPTGAAGPQGLPGPAGPQGPQGPAGATGPQGVQGQPGQSIIGPPGPPGAQGVQGQQGVPGPIGPQGPAGPTGAQGVKGDPGQTLIVDHVVPAVANLPAVPSKIPTVYLVSGTRHVWMFDPTAPHATVGQPGVADGWVDVGEIGQDGPQGPTGAQGAAGPTGPQGPQGLDGPVGPQGPPGPPGPGVPPPTPADVEKHLVVSMQGVPEWQPRTDYLHNVKPWDQFVDYLAGDLVWHGGTLWRADADTAQWPNGPGEAGNPGTWQQVSGAGGVFWGNPAPQGAGTPTQWSAWLVTFPPGPPVGVQAGAPGRWLPGNALTPPNLAGVQALGALGQTVAWLPGQHVVLGDLSHAHWDGTAWRAGDMPHPPVTGAQAGTPGVWLPALALPPADTTALGALGALGQTTAWVNGQHILLGDGSSVWWDGAQWAPGAAPAPPAANLPAGNTAANPRVVTSPATSAGMPVSADDLPSAGFFKITHTPDEYHWLLGAVPDWTKVTQVTVALVNPAGATVGTSTETRQSEMPKLATVVRTEPLLNPVDHLLVHFEYVDGTEAWLRIDP